MYGELISAYNKYEELWNRFNLKRGYPWNDNPWVWVIEFKRLERDTCE